MNSIAWELKIDTQNQSLESTLQLFSAVSACYALRPQRGRKNHAKRAKENHAKSVEE